MWVDNMVRLRRSCALILLCATYYSTELNLVLGLECRRFRRTSDGQPRDKRPLALVLDLEFGSADEGGESEDWWAVNSLGDSISLAYQ